MSDRRPFTFRLVDHDYHDPFWIIEDRNGGIAYLSEHEFREMVYEEARRRGWTEKAGEHL